MQEWLSWFSHKHLKNSLLHVFLIFLTLLTTQMAMSRISAAKWNTNLRVYWLLINFIASIFEWRKSAFTLTHWCPRLYQARPASRLRKIMLTPYSMEGLRLVGTISIEIVRFIWVNLTFVKLNGSAILRLFMCYTPQTLRIPRSKSWNLSMTNMTNCEQIGNLVFFHFESAHPILFKSGCPRGN